MFLLVSILVSAVFWSFVILPGLFKKEFNYLVTKRLNFEPNLLALLENGYLLPFFINSNTRKEPLATNQMLVKFGFLSKRKGFTYFTSQSKNGQFISAFLQGTQQNFQVSLSYVQQEISCSLLCESEKSWNAGLLFYQWKKICSGFSQFVEELIPLMIEKETQRSDEIKEQKELVDLPEITINEQDIEDDAGQETLGLAAVESGQKEVLEESFLEPIYVEIPVTDMYRAQWFYQNVFGFEFFEEQKPSYYISHFKYPNGEFFGALIFGEGYLPQVKALPCTIEVVYITYARELIVQFGGLILSNDKNLNGQEICKFVDIEGNTLGMIAV